MNKNKYFEYDEEVIEGRLLYMQKKYDEAIECFDRVLEEEEHSGAIYQKARSLHMLENYEEAKKYYDKAIAIDVNHPGAWCNKGVVLLQQKKYDEAIECFDRALNINPEYTKAIYNKGNALAEAFKEKAMECFDMAFGTHSFSFTCKCSLQ